jgi:hypothetical protein
MISPVSGSSDAASLTVPFVAVAVDGSRLSPGSYNGQVTVTAPDADNSPQVVTVVVNVLPPGSNPGPVIQPTGLVFRASREGHLKVKTFLFHTLHPVPSVTGPEL